MGPEQVQAALRPDTQLVSLMHVNNEIGVVQDIAAVATLSRARRRISRRRCAERRQVAAERRSDERRLALLTAHKIYGPKGIGALYVRRKPPLGLKPLIYGGGQEYGLRSGTLATHQIVGMGLAFEIAERERQQDVERIGALRDQLWAGISSIGDVELNGHPQDRVAGLLNISFRGVEGESLQFALRELAVSAGGLPFLGIGRSVVRPARARSQRPAGPELAAVQSRPLHHRQQVETHRRREARSRATALVLAPRGGSREKVVSETYNPAVVEHFARPRNVGRFASAADIIAASAGDPDQGVRFDLSARVQGDRIVALRFEVYGCPHCIAAGSLLSERLQGATQDELRRWSWREAADELEFLRRSAVGCSSWKMRSVRSPPSGNAAGEMRRMHQFAVPVRSYNSLTGMDLCTMRISRRP